MEIKQFGRFVGQSRKVRPTSDREVRWVFDGEPQKRPASALDERLAQGGQGLSVSSPILGPGARRGGPSN